MNARQQLPNRRECESVEFRHAGLGFTLCAGSYPDGRIAEIFLSSRKPGSPIEAIARDAAVTVSIALQFGADIETIRQALTKDHDWRPSDGHWRGFRQACGGFAVTLALLDADGNLINVEDVPVLCDGPASRRAINAPLFAAVIFKSHAKRAVGLPPGRNKDASRAEAIRRWPAHAALFARVRDDGRADAALIAIAGLTRANVMGGARGGTDRFAVSLKKQVFNCRGCGARGGRR